MSDKMPSGKWRVRWRVRGQRHMKMFSSKLLADKFEAKIKLNLQKEHVPANEDKGITFAQFSEDWLRDYCRVEKAESQWEEDARTIRNHLIPAFGNVKLVDLKKSDLALLKSKLMQTENPRNRGERYRPKTVNNILGTAKIMMVTAVEWDLLSVNPFASVAPMKIGDQEFDFWKSDERDAFIGQCRYVDPDFADAVVLACHTGMRKGELAGLRWGSVDLKRRKIRVQETYIAKLKKSFKRTKNMKFVDLPVNELVYQTLLNRKVRCGESGDTDPVFAEGFLSSACHRLETRCKWFKIRPIRFHDLRHTFASSLAMAGIDLLMIKELMRHQSYQMTLRYAHLHPDHLEGITNVLCSELSTSKKPEWVMKNATGSRNSDKNNLPGSYLGHETKKGKVVTLPVSS